jgi:hypothetical protein
MDGYLYECTICKCKAATVCCICDSRLNLLGNHCLVPHIKDNPTLHYVIELHSALKIVPNLKSYLNPSFKHALLSLEYKISRLTLISNSSDSSSDLGSTALSIGKNFKYDFDMILQDDKSSFRDPHDRYLYYTRKKTIFIYDTIKKKVSYFGKNDEGPIKNRYSIALGNIIIVRYPDISRAVRVDGSSKRFYRLPLNLLDIDNYFYFRSESYLYNIHQSDNKTLIVNRENLNKNTRELLASITCEFRIASYLVIRNKLYIFFTLDKFCLVFNTDSQTFKKVPLEYYDTYPFDSSHELVTLNIRYKIYYMDLDFIHIYDLNLNLLQALDGNALINL